MAQVQMEIFEIAEAKRLLTACALLPKIIVNEEMVKDIALCTTYLKKFFYPLDNGGHLFLKKGIYVFMDQADVKKVYFNRLGKEINIWYFTQYDVIFELINDVNKPAIEGNCINMCSGFKWKITKKYAEFPIEIRKKVDVFISYMKEVLCSDSQASLEYILKWYSVMCKGKKNDSLLYFKGVEGTGKSTNIDFIYKHVLGQGICVKPGSECLTSNFNKILAGKLFVVFEELPTFSTNMWDGVSSKLKEMITGDRAVYRDLYEKHPNKAQSQRPCRASSSATPAPTTPPPWRWLAGLTWQLADSPSQTTRRVAQHSWPIRDNAPS